jgi:hypothetical protein
MSESRVFRVLVVAPGSSPVAVTDALTALVTHDRHAVDELHVLVPTAAVERLRDTLLGAPFASALTGLCQRLGIARSDMLFGRRTIHSLGGPERTHTATSQADDVLETIQTLCRDNLNEVTIVAALDAGSTGVLAHSALQLVGRPSDRFFMLEHVSKRRARRPLLEELPMVLAERALSAGQRYQDVAASRQRARRRLTEPGVFRLNARRRALLIDDVVVSLPRLQFFWMFCLATFAPRHLPHRILSGHFDVDAHGRIAVAPHHPQRAEIEAVIAHLRRIFVTLFPDAPDEFAMVFSRACGAAPGLPSIIAKLNANLKRSLGIGAAPYLIAGGRGAPGYRLIVPPQRIKLEPLVSAPEIKPSRAE